MIDFFGTFHAPPRIFSGDYVAALDSRGRSQHGYFERLDPYYTQTAYLWQCLNGDAYELRPVITDSIRRNAWKEPSFNGMRWEPTQRGAVLDTTALEQWPVYGGR